MFQSGGGEAPKDFTVSELAAEDGSTGERMELIDEQGCVVNTSIVRSLNKPRPNQLQIEITFSGFPDQAQVTYQSLVKPCHQDCSPACNRNYWVDSKG
ncbi:Protein CUTL-28 [Aphelenchoides avenae]|nr:Protein CUTL-28 [Aphelenchus avenae]